MIKNILVPVDGSESAMHAVERAVELAQASGAKLSFLYVANINQLAINAFLTDAIMKAVNDAGDAVLNEAAEKVPAGVTVESFSETGSPSVTILDFAEEHPVDLIVIGCRGLGLVEGVLLGSVSQYVVEQSKCPVLVVK